MSVPGLTVLKKILPENIRIRILDLINTSEWSEALSRRVQHYGFEYDYNLREPQAVKLKKTKPIPDLLVCVGEALYESGLLPHMPNQVIVNEYEAGQGIGKHRDHHPIFADGIATITLEGRCTMDFEPYGIYKKEYPENFSVSQFLEPGDLVVMTKEARYKFSHEIKKRKTDVVGGKKIPRTKRISLTFRTHQL